jgi:hypothetical protein
MNENIGDSWKLWKECLLGEDSNSIFNQISNMIWDVAIFNLFDESWRTQKRKHNELPGLNIRLQMFITWNFITAQVSSIRRLVDSYEIRGHKGVYSIRALIKDIRKKHEILTREVFLESQGLPLFFSSESDTPDPAVWLDISEAHKRFDILSGIQPENRSKTDKISLNVLDGLDRKLDSCTQIKKYVDKYIAHPSTPESRILDNFRSVDITLNQLRI